MWLLGQCVWDGGTEHPLVYAQAADTPAAVVYALWTCHLSISWWQSHTALYKVNNQMQTLSTKIEVQQRKRNESSWSCRCWSCHHETWMSSQRTQGRQLWWKRIEEVKPPKKKSHSKTLIKILKIYVVKTLNNNNKNLGETSWHWKHKDWIRIQSLKILYFFPWDIEKMLTLYHKVTWREKRKLLLKLTLMICIF